MTKNLTKYAFGGLAGKLLQSKESGQYVTGALDALTDELGLGEEAKGFIEGAYASKEGIQTASSVYSNIYQEKLSESKGSDLAIWYSNSFEGLDDADKSRIVGILNAHGDKTLKEISLELAKAEYVLQNPEKDKITEEDRNKANELKAKYGNFLYVQNLLEEFKMEEFRPDAVSKSRKRELKGLAAKL